jgi:hypothetical protein
MGGSTPVVVPEGDLVFRGKPSRPLTLFNDEIYIRTMLTMKFRQPSHEFSFGVGISFISYPLVLPPWYNKFIRACRFWSLMFMQGFSVESETSGIRSLSTS